MSASEPVSLAVRFRLAQSFSRSRGRHGRWADLRHVFEREHEPYAARVARYAMLDCGPRTRERWLVEYRHQRRLAGIGKGRRYPDDNHDD
jgi:hypothetical protein